MEKALVTLNNEFFIPLQFCARIYICFKWVWVPALLSLLDSSSADCISPFSSNSILRA